ncbi:hypothetical protein ACIA5D_37610 [Actinoplanes sp. NPDC051513]|uniref:hypothetical protein n=1 Tax=Actinoplanes sp. NPDC051513 TaxID=3363908 RepID=UPI0037A24BA8
MPTYASRTNEFGTSDTAVTGVAMVLGTRARITLATMNMKPAARIRRQGRRSARSRLRRGPA